MRLAARLRVTVQKARRDPVEFTRWVGRIEGGAAINVANIHKEWHQHLSDHQQVVLFAPVGHGKRLPIDTPIATPDGWRAIGDLQVGDSVLGGDGYPTRVTWVSPTAPAPESYELVFKDGARVVADADHQWAAWTTDDRDSGNPPRVVTTREIVGRFTTPAGRNRWSIPLAGPAQYPEAVLPLHPYALGAWLGDGRSNRGVLYFHREDAEVFDRAARLSGLCPGDRVLEPNGTTYRQTLRGMRAELRKMGLLDNKHVPDIYLTASEDQRRELLAGLMDTDGCVHKQDNRLEFCSTSRPLADAVLELVRSLGEMPTITEGRAMLRGKDCGPKYRVCWTSWARVFRLRRKDQAHAAAIQERGALPRSTFGLPRGRTIVSWRQVAPQPMRCISVEAAPHTYIATRQYIVTHNTNQITRWRALWEIGKNPNIRIAIVSATKELPAKVLNGIRQDISGAGPGSEWLRLVFPHLARQNWKVWSGAKMSLTRTDALNDPTISTFSPGTQILGSRFDLIIADDLHNIANTLNPDQREKMHRWFTGEVLSRDSPAGTRVWVLGHVWNEDDVLHRLSREDGFWSKKYSCYIDDPKTGARAPLIPEIWSLDALAKREARLGPINSKLMLFNEHVDSGSGRIRREYFLECLRRGSTLGARFPTHWRVADAPTFTGVDLGFGGGSLTVAFTAAVYPDGSRRILEIRSGDWSGPEIIEQLKDVHARFGSQLVVESNGAQVLIEEFATDLSALPIKKHHTGMNKHDEQYGVEHIATELCNRKWIIPCEDDLKPCNEVARWINECAAYSPDTHAGDRLMASWICREGIRLSGAGNGRMPDTFFDVDTLQR